MLSHIKTMHKVVELYYAGWSAVPDIGKFLKTCVTKTIFKIVSATVFERIISVPFKILHSQKLI